MRPTDLLTMAVQSVKRYAELDYMEYSSDALAQAAYVSSDVGYTADLVPQMTSNILPSGVASADSGFYAAWNAMKNDNTTDSDCWYSGVAAYPHWLQYQFTSGKVITRYTITSRNHLSSILSPRDFTLQGSNNATDWTTLNTQAGQSFTQNQKRIYSFSNATSYTYYRLYITVGSEANYSAVGEFELVETVLQSYSESTIKTQGSYSLKGVAAITDSLNDTLTKTVSTIDMSGVNKVKFDIRSSRTGDTLQLHIHDSGGTTTSTTAITIASADVFQSKEIDLSGVADANKDAIDEIVVTVTNADAANTFYIDNLRYR